MKRPYITLNMAQSINGYISKGSGERAFISSQEDRERFMELRNQSDGVLVGVNTVLKDNPYLDAPKNRETARIVIDPKCRLKGSFNVLDGSRTTIILNSLKNDSYKENLEYVKCGSPLDLDLAMEKLAERGMKKILVEGGKFTAESFLKKGLIDSMFLFVGDLFLEEGSIQSPIPLREIRNVILDVRIMKGGVLYALDPRKFKVE